MNAGDKLIVTETSTVHKIMNPTIHARLDQNHHVIMWHKPSSYYVKGFRKQYRRTKLYNNYSVSPHNCVL